MEDKMINVLEASEALDVPAIEIIEEASGGRIGGALLKDGEWSIPLSSLSSVSISHSQGSKSASWYEKRPLPDGFQERMRKIAMGEEIDRIALEGNEIGLLRTDGRTFRCIFNENRKNLYNGEFLAHSAENDYESSSCYITEDGLAGFSITPDGHLVSLFSNSRYRGFAKAIAHIVRRDARLLSCIAVDMDSSLIRLYRDCFGFEVLARTRDDTELLGKYYGREFIEAFVSAKGHPFHVFMARCGKRGRDIMVFDGYFEADRYMKEGEWTST